MEKEKPGSFRLSSDKKYGNGSYVLVFMLLSGIFTTYEDRIPPHSLSTIVGIVVFTLRLVLDTGLMYFFVLWIADVIRRKRKTGKPESKKFRLIVNIIFSVIFLIMFVTLLQSALKTQKASELTPQETSFMTEFQEKTGTFVIKSDELKVAMQGFMDVLKSEDMSKMHQALQSVQNTSLALQPEIDNQKVFVEQNWNLFKESNEKKKQFIEGYAKAIDVRDRHNRKLTDLVTYGLKIDWNNPTKTQMEEWTRIADELAVIEKELQTTQSEFQALVQAQS